MTGYEDMINLPYHPKNAMEREKRAAQFAPFAALTGYDEAVEAEGRMTEKKKVLCEDALDELDAILQVASECPEVDVRISCFVNDLSGTEGERMQIEGRIQEVEDFSVILMEDGRKINRTDVENVEIIRGGP